MSDNEIDTAQLPALVLGITISMLSNLPNEILIRIFTQLRGICETNKHLSTCCLVDQQWKAAMTPILYGNIAVSSNNLPQFLASGHLESKHRANIYSITISYHGSAPGALAHAPMLPQLFSNLRSFSLHACKWSTESSSHDDFIPLIESLPECCVNLEVHLENFSSKPFDGGRSEHLCDALRKVLPRMRHVRLRLMTCKALFEEPSSLNNMIRIPQLKTLIYHCVRTGGAPLGTCPSAEASLYHHDGSLLWHSVTQSLENLIATPGAVPEDARIYAFTHTDRDNSDRSLWTAYIRADMQSRISLALPHRHVWMESMIRGSYLVRLADGSEMMATSTEIEDLAEGRFWREAVGGMRLPAAILHDEKIGNPSFATGCVEEPMKYLQTSEEWRKKNPRKTTGPWGNERLAGMKLIGAQTRSGANYLSRAQVREATPAGFKRTRDGYQLLKIGD